MDWWATCNDALDWNRELKSAWYSSLTHRLAGREGASVLRGAALLSMGMAIGRVLGFLFSVILAAAFVPSEYGAIKYTITLGSLVAIVTQPFGQHVLARFIGMYRKAPEQLHSFFSNAWMILIALIVISAAVATFTLVLLNRFDFGIMAVFVGTSFFYTYWGISSGSQAYGRLTIAYLGSNLLQLVLVIVLFSFLKINSPLLAVVIFGLSYFPPLLLLQSFSPIGIRFRASLLQKKKIIEILRFSSPIWISHASYVVCGALPVLVLEHYFGMADVGIYSLATTLAMVFMFVPSSIATLLMPKTSELPAHMYGQLLKRMLGLSSLFNGILLLLFVVSIKWGVEFVFSSAYLRGVSVFIIGAIDAILKGAHNIITAVIVGSGKPSYETISRLSILIITLLGAWLVIPVYGPLGAALTSCLGFLVGLAVYAIIAVNIPFLKPFQYPSREI